LVGLAATVWFESLEKTEKEGENWEALKAFDFCSLTVSTLSSVTAGGHGKKITENGPSIFFFFPLANIQVCSQRGTRKGLTW